METVLITGGSGLIGRSLSMKLSAAGYEVVWLSRKDAGESPYKVFKWSPEEGTIDNKAVINTDYIIHLAGANIGEKRWTRSRRRLIIGSRAGTTELLFRAFAESRKLKAFITASATGYYGAITSENIFTENESPATDFLGQTCRMWEESADRFGSSGIRTVKIRTGVVLTSEGGALPGMAAPVRAGFGSAIGKGSQYIPWIHIDDLCSIYLKAINDESMTGAYNAAAPGHQTSKTFVASLAKALHKPFWFPNIPSFILKAVFGEMAVILLEGTRVSSEKLTGTGFRFAYPDLDLCLRAIYS